MLVLAARGVSAAAPFDDAMLISYSQEAGMHGHGLDELSQLHLGHTPMSYDEVTGTGRGRLAFPQVPIERATAYAAEHADVALRLWHVLRPRLRFNGALALYEQVERRLLPVLLRHGARRHQGGCRDLRRMSADFEQRMGVIETEIHRLAGRAFNVGSAKQLGEVLFDEMKLGGGKRMKTGAWGTDASVLQTLAEQGHELPARILEWRQLQKLKSTYADALVGEINPDTARVHTSYAHVHRINRAAVLERSESAEHSRFARRKAAASAAPLSRSRGMCWSCCDYSQIELRLLAHVADDPAAEARVSCAARTSMPAPRARCSACRWRAWTR